MSVISEGSLLLVGAGKMGGALLAGFLDQGLSPSRVFVRDPSPSPDAARLIAERGIAINFSIADIAAKKPSVVLLAVKPQGMESVLPELKPLVSPSTLFLSIAAGTSLLRLKELLGADVHAVRAMPNTPAAVGRGITVACSNELVTPAQKEVATALLASVGEVGWVDSEPLIDAVTAISGSGPAYVFYLAECLATAGEALGLDPQLAMKLARATISGSGEMLHLLPEDAAILRKNVTSPGGTTAAALDILMGENGLSPLLRKATAAARNRARELGQ